ncbi:unnamed protein product [Thlaspi arvense]|uniref:Bifunctional inhibitor/plant lipid transfer protein/seed storage helical domain-containing protein n=1 Tax=Thlaspi arvense TaxID=13288 RepID=A0AAU9SNC0_THLAR|nr:unnamed protein product [Thlaspi arvense]
MDIGRYLGVVTVIVILYSVKATAQFGEVMRCVEKVMPCRPYMHSESPPPSWCCDTMKEIIENDMTCLCAAFNHPDMLRYIDLTKENALNVLKSCGANYDGSLCTSTTSRDSSSTASSGSTSSGMH